MKALNTIGQTVAACPISLKEMLDLSAMWNADETRENMRVMMQLRPRSN